MAILMVIFFIAAVWADEENLHYFAVDDWELDQPVYQDPFVVRHNDNSSIK